MNEIQKQIMMGTSLVVQWLKLGMSLVVQWLKLYTPNAGGQGSRSLVRELDPVCCNEELSCHN